MSKNETAARAGQDQGLVTARSWPSRRPPDDQRAPGPARRGDPRHRDAARRGPVAPPL